MAGLQGTLKAGKASSMSKIMDSDDEKKNGSGIGINVQPPSQPSPKKTLKQSKLGGDFKADNAKRPRGMAIDDSDSEIDTANLKPAAKKTRKASNAGTANNKSEGKKDYLVDYKSEYKWLDLKGQEKYMGVSVIMYDGIPKGMDKNCSVAGETGCGAKGFASDTTEGQGEPLILLTHTMFDGHQIDKKSPRHSLVHLGCANHKGAIYQILAKLGDSSATDPRVWKTLNGKKLKKWLASNSQRAGKPINPKMKELTDLPTFAITPVPTTRNQHAQEGVAFVHEYWRQRFADGQITYWQDDEDEEDDDA